MDTHKREKHQKGWTRREILTAGGALALGLASCDEHTRSINQHIRTKSISIKVPMQTSIKSTALADRPVTLAFTGDVMFGRTVNSHLLATSPDDPFPFTHTTAFLHAFDLTIGNLECVISRLGTPVDKPRPFILHGDPRAYRRLMHAGFDVVSVANNHSGDYGKEAFVDEIMTLPEHGITPVGGGRNKHEAHAPVFKTVRNTTVGFLAYDEIAPYYFAATDTTPGHAWLNEENVRRDVPLARKEANFVIVFMHWGTEYITTFNAHQRHLARVAIDSGADLVVGAHPHVIEPYEYYRGKPIIYSLGNFVFDYMDADVVRRGNILTLTLNKEHLLNWKLIPTYIGKWGEPILLFSPPS
ncbi:MAG: CapA family protein [Ktedonobacteraceae bacterium]|nr:CapA family protein [Ktedonobacteraceae bacterium]